MTFYKTKKWLNKRAYILKRDKYMCNECKRYGITTPATTVHHIKHYETHKELGLCNSNLVSLCAKCHNKMHPEKGKKKPPYA